MFKKKYIPPAYKVTDKDEIISFAKIYIADNNYWADMNSFIWNDMKYSDAPTSFIFSVATAMEVSGKYKLSVQDKTGYYVITPLPKKSWKDRYWWLIAIIGFIIGWFADIAKEVYLQKSKTEQIKSEQAIPKATDSVGSFHTDTDKKVVQTSTDSSKMTQRK